MATLQYSVKHIGQLTLVTIGGSLDAQTAPLLSEKLTIEIKKKPQFLVINMSKISYIASAGLGILISTHEEVAKNKGELRLCCLTDKVKNIFKLLGFINLFKIFDSEDAACS